MFEGERDMKEDKAEELKVTLEQVKELILRLTYSANSKLTDADYQQVFTALRDYKRLREALQQAGDALEVGAQALHEWERVTGTSPRVREWQAANVQYANKLRALKEMGK
jgi:hypothetical protein